MSVHFFTYAERSDLVDRYRDDAEDFWEEGMVWIHHDPVCETYWARLSDEFANYQFLVYDGGSDQFLARANTIPFRWDKPREGLPDGVDGVLPLAFDQRDEGITPNTLCALLAWIQPGVKSTGLSRQLLEHMKVLARWGGLTALVAPVRPNQKARYPLIRMERYARWRSADGMLLDPWLRTHERLGQSSSASVPTRTCSGGRWASGSSGRGWRYTRAATTSSPRLAPLRVDRERDAGVLVEPNVWMKHDLV